VKFCYSIHLLLMLATISFRLAQCVAFLVVSTNMPQLYSEIKDLRDIGYM